MIDLAGAVHQSPFNRLRLRRMIRRMTYDDALYCGEYQLEYLEPLIGFPYYRLSRCGGLVGIVDVRAARHLAGVQQQLAAYLDELGLRAENTRLVIFGATTPADANKHRLPHLFRASDFFIYLENEQSF